MSVQFMTTAEFINHISTFCKQRNITKGQLSDLTGLGIYQINLVLGNRIGLKNPDNIFKICKGLGIDDVILSDNGFGGFIINPDPETQRVSYMKIDEVTFANCIRSRIPKKARDGHVINTVSDMIKVKKRIIQNILNGVHDPLSYTDILSISKICEYFKFDINDIMDISNARQYTVKIDASNLTTKSHTNTNKHTNINDIKKMIKSLNFNDLCDLNDWIDDYALKCVRKKYQSYFK